MASLECVLRTEGIIDENGMLNRQGLEQAEALLAFERPRRRGIMHI